MDKKRPMMPPLSKRLAAAVSFVDKGKRVADVGCDHGYTAISLRNAGVSPFCICADVNTGPLEAASENILKYGASGIETRLCDGLSGISPGEADCIVITGMGGELICRILEDGKDAVRTADELVLGPQSEPEKVRRKIYETGYLIDDEAFIFEDGKYYPIIKAVKRTGSVPGEAENAGFDSGIGKTGEAEMLFGPKLLEKRDEELKVFLEKERKRYSAILRNLEVQNPEKGGEQTAEIQSRIEEIRHLLTLINRAWEYYG